MPVPITTVLLILLLACLHPCLRADLVPVPASSREITDPATGVPATITVSPFLIGRAEITQAEFKRITGYNPSFHKGDNLPVENVSWWEAIRYCNLRSEAEGLEPCYDLDSGRCDFSRNGYRLPTNAEWDAANVQGEEVITENIHRFANLGGSDNKSVPLLMKDIRERSPRPAGSYPANSLGLHDMIGNVWEWCNDYKNPVTGEAIPLHNPRGPLWSAERVLRGGSYLSLVNHWARGFHSSLDPDHRSRFAGFRVCRSDDSRDGAVPPVPEDAFFEPYNRVPSGFEGTGGLSSLVRDSRGGAIKTVVEWEKHRAALLDKWGKLLGRMPEAFPGPNVKLLHEYRDDLYTGRLMRLQVEKDYWEKILVMLPHRPLRTPTPVVIVPYYDVDTPAGKNLGGRSYMPPSVRSFALLAVKEGYIAVAVRWFGESYAPGYAETVASLKIRHPELSGLGKWVWDSQRLLDYVVSMPGVDPQNIGIIGHSLGGKMSLYAAAFDKRITAAVGSDLGIGLEFSNYEDYWYFDKSIQDRDKATDHHELLGFIAPRPFLLIAGEDADNDRSWHFINAAREVYSLFGDPRRAAIFNHRTGHTPTPEAMRLAIDWLKRFLGEPGRER